MPSSENPFGFELEIGSLSSSDILLGQVVGFEGLSAPFRFELDLQPSGSEPFDLPGLVGERATLRFRTAGGGERPLHGVVRTLELQDVLQGHPHYRAELVPRFALLQSTAGNRIFQNKNVPDIVKEVLDAHQVKFRLALSGSYAKREFCVQYAESDLRFVSRLLEDEGISYFFEQGDDAEVLVLADGAGSYPELTGDSTLPFRDPRAGAISADDHVFAFHDNRRIRTGKVTLRDYDFAVPDVDLTATQASGEETELEIYEYPGGYTGPLVGKRLAKARLEAVRSGRHFLDGASSCSRLGAGSTFSLAEHPVDALNQKLLAVRVEHRGVQPHRLTAASESPAGYSNRFVCVPADEPIRPERVTPRPRIPGAQTATVVGPAGEEIHPDGHARIRVKFHWDRLGKKDEHASCFVRLAQRWAGGGYGQSVIPRIGQEVIVSFLEGNPDRPLVVGAVYNGSNAVPTSLPGDRTQSVFRTDSSTGGGGSNELRFEDAKGSERLAIHAQKDERFEVQRDKRQQVGANESLDVGKDRSRHIGGNQALRVAGRDSSKVGKDQTISVTGKRQATVVADDAHSVGIARNVQISGASSTVVAGASVESVGAAAALSVGGVYAVNVGGVYNIAVAGNLSRQVAGKCVEMVAGSRTETVDKDCTVTVKGDFEEQTEGSATFNTAKDVQETIDGKVEVDVKKELAIMAKSLELQADTLTIIVGGKVALQMQSGNVTFGANKAVIDASGNLTLKGSKINKEGSGSADSKSVDLKKLEDLRKSKASVKVAAKAAGGAPLANLKFKAELPDGSTVEGKTDGAGNAAIPASKDGDVKLSFPDLDAGAWKTE